MLREGGGQPRRQRPHRSLAIIVDPPRRHALSPPWQQGCPGESATAAVGWIGIVRKLPDVVPVAFPVLAAPDNESLWSLSGVCRGKFGKRGQYVFQSVEPTCAAFALTGIQPCTSKGVKTKEKPSCPLQQQVGGSGADYGALALPAAPRTLVQRQRWRRRGRWCLGIASCSLARSCDGNGSRAEDGASAMPAILSYAVPMVAAAAQTTVPWHSRPFSRTLARQRRGR